MTAPHGKPDVTLDNSIRNIAQTLIEGLFPRFCARCGAEGSDFCASCLEAYSPGPFVRACVFCGKKDMLGWTCDSCTQGTNLDGCVSLAPYSDPVVRGAIQRWKYQGNRRLEGVIVRWIRSRIELQLFPLCDWTVTSVPLHLARQRERGFDQGERIAEAVSETLGRPHRALLRRVHWTEPQARLGASERRLGDLDHAFTVSAPVPSSVILCDDVVTSASTMDAAALALRQAGAEVVFGFSLARGRAH